MYMATIVHEIISAVLPGGAGAGRMPDGLLSVTGKSRAAPSATTSSIKVQYIRNVT
jgi:hypothetical protein